MTNPWTESTPWARRGWEATRALLAELNALAADRPWQVAGPVLVPGPSGGIELDAVLITDRHLYVFEVKHLPGVIRPHPVSGWLQQRPSGEIVHVRSGWGQVMNGAGRLHAWLSHRLGGSRGLPVLPRVILAAVPCRVEGLPGFVREILWPKSALVERVTALEARGSPNPGAAAAIGRLIQGLPTWDEVHLGTACLHGVVETGALPTPEGELPLRGHGQLAITGQAADGWLEAIWQTGRHLWREVRLLAGAIRFRQASGRLVDLVLRPGMTLCLGH